MTRLLSWWTIVQVALFSGVPLLLLCLPKNFFDKGDPVCVSVKLLGIECPGCGLTRGIMHLIHLDWMAAYYYNVLSFVFLPILIWLWIGFFKKALTEVWTWFTFKKKKPLN